MEFIISQPILHLPLILISLLVINELFRRFKWMSIIVGIIALLLIPVWIQSGISAPFTWAKLISLIIGVSWLSLFRFTNFAKKSYAKIGLIMIVWINIAEAVIQDFSTFRLAGTISAISGILLICSLKGWQEIDLKENQYKDIIWPQLTVSWVAAYTIWNWIFAYLNFPERATYHLMVLLAASVATYFAKGPTWMQARGYTLLTFFMYFFTFAEQVNKHAVLLPRNESIMLILALVSLSANIINILFTYRQFLFQKPTSSAPAPVGAPATRSQLPPKS